MKITGDLLIGHEVKRGENGEIYGVAAASGNQLQPAFGGATLSDLEQACHLADLAFDDFRAVSLEKRAEFLDRIGANIMDLGEELVERCMLETGLPRARVEGERGRTVGQLALFANVIREGLFLDARIDPALPDRKPLARVDLRLRNIPVGPVAVFGASNFPLAFSVAGGDTASAFAAGCPVIVKAHSAHPGTSELVGRAVQKAVKECELPEGVFSLLFDSGRTVGQSLVADHRIKAVGFTGSRTGGVALMNIAANREEPIPVYAEMSSINPVILFENALTERSESIANAFIASLTQGAGQFCTNPGLVLAIDTPYLRQFEEYAATALSKSTAATMLTPGIFKSFCQGVQKLEDNPQVNTLAKGASGNTLQAQAALFSTTATDFLKSNELKEEVFGSASLIVRCQDLRELKQVLRSLEGQLTIAAHISNADNSSLKSVLPILEKKAGRVLVNGFGTGVEVCHAMVHGGPFPATSDTRTTSVGSLAINRFLRPVSYQDFPEELLPDELKPTNPLELVRLVNGNLEK